MKKPLIIIVIAIIIIGAGVAVYFVTQNKNTNTNAPTNSASQTNTSAATNTASADKYVGDDFTILKPADWLQSQMSGTLVSFHNTSEVHPEGSAAKKINFNSYLAVSFDMVNEKSLAEINDFTIDQIKESIPSAEVTASSDETIDGQPAKFNVFTLSQQEVDYTVFLAVILKGDKYYVISGNTTTDKWNQYKDLFYDTAGSFQLISNTNTNSVININSSVTNNSNTNIILGNEEGNTPYTITSDPNPNTKHFMLDLINGQFNYSRIIVNPGDSFRITLMENGTPVDFTFPSTGQVSENGTFSTVVDSGSESAEVNMECLNRVCGQLELVINE